MNIETICERIHQNCECKDFPYAVAEKLINRYVNELKSKTKQLRKKNKDLKSWDFKKEKQNHQHKLNALFYEKKYNDLKIKFDKLQKKIDAIINIEYGFKVKQQLKEFLKE